MFNIITMTEENKLKLYREYQVIDLTSKDRIERQFVSEVSMATFIDDEFSTFHDELSLKLMIDIDTAKYIGIWDIETNLGKTCISSLSTGCKLGLLLLHFRRHKKCLVKTSWCRAGNNVWQWFINNDIDITFISDEESIASCYPRITNANTNDYCSIFVDGVECSIGDAWDKHDALFDIDTDVFMKQVEEYRKNHKMYHTVSGKFYDVFGNDIKDSLKDELISTVTNWNVRNHCSEIDKDLTWEYPVMWDYNPTSKEDKLFKGYIYKYPSFDDVVAKAIERACECKRWYMITVFNAPGKMLCREAFKNVSFCVVANSLDKTVEVHNREETIDLLYNIFKRDLEGCV